MSPDLASSLRTYAESMPAGTVLPVAREVLLELLSADVCKTPDLAAVDLTVAQLADRFSRKPSAVRAWLERGDFPQAYKLHGREWRVPPAAVEAFQQRQRAEKGRPAKLAGVAGLDAWRRAGGGKSCDGAA